MGAHQVETRVVVQTMETSIRDVASGSKGWGDRWATCAKTRLPNSILKS
jgi:hypothetical protein